ncbi:MAG: response regulator, partial [Bacteroidota bacterium]
ERLLDDHVDVVGAVLSIGVAREEDDRLARVMLPDAGRLLVVDDEEMVRSVTGRLLRLKGHEVDEAEGGDKALALIADHPYDLVLTDLSMPEMSGRELAFRIRQHHPRQPIILLTGDTDAEDGTDHVDVVVKKPFKLDDLEAVVQRLLNG